VNRNKRPALTSPWKIGFLVSLLLVTVSIGVGFAITRTFGVAWSWIHTGDGSWAFDLDAFLNEMLPLVVIVPVMSLLSYFVITGAVRKYRAYLDSGQGLGGTETPFLIHLTCIQVLEANQDPRAGEVLGRVYDQLQERAASIPDEATRHAFLEKVPWHREIVRAGEERTM